MTREEAIKQLDTMWKMLTSAYDDIADSHVAAYTMAVDALKAQGTCDDAVSRQTLQEELALYPIDDITSEDEAGYNRAINDVQKMVLHLPSAQPEPFTDKEQRIFLAAMWREEKVCREMDRNYIREPYEDSLMRVCKEIRRKVKGALWT